MSNYISKIEDKVIHDASSLHGITANSSTYTLQVGEADSVYGKTVEVGLPDDVITVIDNLTLNLKLKNSSSADIECYNKSEMDSFKTELKADVSLYQNQTGLMDEFDPYTLYYKNSYVRYNEYYWRCIVNQFQGAFDEACWIKTNLLEEIIEIRRLLLHL